MDQKQNVLQKCWFEICKMIYNKIVLSMCLTFWWSAPRRHSLRKQSGRFAEYDDNDQNGHHMKKTDET